MNTLDRYLTRQFLRNAGFVVIAITVVFVVLDILLSFHLLTRVAPSPWVKVELFLCRIPGLLNFALPVSAVIASLACVAPMLRRGEFTALGAAGIRLQHATRSLVVGCLLLGIADGIIADFATPPATARALALQDLLEGQNREGRVWRTDEGATWFAGGAKLVGVAEPSMRSLVVADRDRMALIDALVWRQGAWIAPSGLSVLTVRDGAQRLDRLPPGLPPAGLGLAMPPDELYRRLLPRYTMTSVELLHRGERADMATVGSRWSRIFMPVLAVLAALAIFVRFRNRDRVAVATIEAVGAALVPSVLLAGVGTVVETAPGPPIIVLIVGVSIAALPSILWWVRWKL